MMTTMTTMMNRIIPKTVQPPDGSLDVLIYVVALNMVVSKLALNLQNNEQYFTETTPLYLSYLLMSVVKFAGIVVLFIVEEELEIELV